MRPVGTIFAFAMCLFLASDVRTQDLSALRSAINGGSSDQKRAALYEIRNLKNETASRIAVPALTDPDEVVRGTAAASIIYLPKDEAAGLLIPLLHDRSEFVRREAAYALGESGSALSVPELIARLETDIESVAAASAVALGSTGDPAAVGPLVAIVRKHSADEFLRRSAAGSIGRIAAFLRTGKRMTVTPQNFLPAKFKTEGTALGPVTSSYPAFKAAIPVLTSILNDRKDVMDVRRETAFALGAIGESDSRKTLSRFIDDPDTYLAEICREALLQLAHGS